MTDRQGVEIDYCPTCRGVWLDRGELDKIIERADVQGPPTAVPPPAPARPDPRTESVGYPQQGYPQGGYAQPGYQQYPQYPKSPDSPDYRGQGYDPRYGGRRRKKKDSFLGDLFDF
jgi:Zn-finger nucleic acid-binding protein